MKVEFWTVASVGIFVLIVAPSYWFITHDPTGTWALSMTFALMAMLSGYLWFVGKAVGIRPEDRADGEIAEGAGELGFFPPFSWWPLFCAAVMAVAVFAIADAAWWLLILLIPFGIVVAVGWVFEYYRGIHAH